MVVALSLFLQEKKQELSVAKAITKNTDFMMSFYFLINNIIEVHRAEARHVVAPAFAVPAVPYYVVLPG